MKWMLVAAAALLGTAVAAPTGKDLAELLALNSNIRVGVLTNVPTAADPPVDCSEMGASAAACHITYVRWNYSGEAVMTKNWALYFHSFRRVLAVRDEKLKVTLVTGDLHVVEPADGFTELRQGIWEFHFVIEGASSNFQTDFFPRYWFVVEGDDSTATVVPNTDTVTNQPSFVDPHDGDKWKTSLENPMPQANVTTRYARQQAMTLLGRNEIAADLIPKPLKTTRQEGSADISKGVRITADELKAEAVRAVVVRLKTLQVEESDDGYPIEVRVSTDLPNAVAKAEGYTLTVGPEKATVVGYDSAGAFYGLQSFIGLMKVGSGRVPCVDIEDAPRFPLREQHIDIARTFHSKGMLLKAIDQMAAYKINKFHLHISDDEAWRVEIRGLPELTEVGAKRCMDMTETKCLLPQLASGPTSENFGSGFLSRKDYIDIVKYGNDRFIEVYPEFDMPGHSRAATVSMEARYRKFAEQGDLEKAEEYRLLDPEDTSGFMTIQHYDHRSQINSCMPGALRFIRKVVQEVVAMHTDAGVPLKRWHFGADEAHNILLGAGFVDKDAPAEEKVGKGQIDKSGLTEPFGRSPACVRFFEERGMKDGNELLGYLAVEVSKILVENGVDTFVAWNDGMKEIDSSRLATKTNILKMWDAHFWGAPEAVVAMIEKGYTLVMSNPDFLYFDFPQENNPKERGYYWAGRDQTLKNTFSFAPLNTPQNAEIGFDARGGVYELGSPKLPSGKTMEGAIQGISGQLWTETVLTGFQLYEQLFPRMLAMAERAWHKADWELDYAVGRTYNSETSFVDKDAIAQDYNRFANIIGQKEAEKMEADRVGQRLPVPGAVIENGTLYLNSEIPGIPMWYSCGSDTMVKAEGAVSITPRTCRVGSSFGERFGADIVFERSSRVETVHV